jgi:anti-sigma B factor antagonist
VLFALDVTMQQGWTVLSVTGELELATAPQMRQRVVGLVGEGRTHIIVDLSGVDFIDSIGLGVVVAALKRARSHGGEVIIAGAVPRVRAVFEITRLVEIIDFFADVDEALVANAPSRRAGPRSRQDG